MKKLIIVLFAIFCFCACASNHKSGEQDKFMGKRPSLTQIHKQAQEIVASMEAHALFLELNENKTEEEKKELADIKNVLENWDKEEDVIEWNKYSIRPITLVDGITVHNASEEGYSDIEIDKFLGLGLYVKNPYCEKEFSSYEVFQVLPDYVLANGCEKTDYDKCNTLHGKIFMYPKQKDELYFDKKILSPQKDYCSVYIGTFNYKSKDENVHTVPILWFSPKVIFKAGLEDIKKLREKQEIHY